MKEDLNIEKLFQDKFENFEGNVSPDVWANISSSIGTTATTTATTAGLSTMAKVAIVSGGIIIASVAGVLIVNSSNEEEGTEPVIEETTEPIAENEIPENTTTLVVEDEGDSAIENYKEEIAKAQEENEIEEVEITKEEVEDIIKQVKINPTNPIMFNIGTSERGENPAEENVVEEDNSDNTPSEDNASNDNETASEETKEESSNSSSSEVVVKTMDEIEEEVDEVENEEIVQDEKCITTFNVFTPNGDFKNDVWSVKTIDIDVFVINVFNTNGEVVFTSSDKDFEWDGTNAFGDRVEAGVYNYMIVSERSNGKKLVTQGSVTVQY